MYIYDSVYDDWKGKEDEFEEVDPVGEVEEVEKAVSNSQAIKKELTTNGEYFKQEMKTNLLIKAIKNSAKVTGNPNGEPLINEGGKFNPNSRLLRKRRKRKKMDYKKSKPRIKNYKRRRLQLANNS